MINLSFHENASQRPAGWESRINNAAFALDFADVHGAALRDLYGLRLLLHLSDCRCGRGDRSRCSVDRSGDHRRSHDRSGHRILVDSLDSLDRLDVLLDSLDGLHALLHGLDLLDVLDLLDRLDNLLHDPLLNHRLDHLLDDPLLDDLLDLLDFLHNDALLVVVPEQSGIRNRGQKPHTDNPEDGLLDHSSVPSC
jgi:hypothetical protein